MSRKSTTKSLSSTPSRYTRKKTRGKNTQVPKVRQQSSSAIGHDENKADVIRLRNMEWIVDRLQNNMLPIYTLDFETDPFVHGQVPKPFLCGFYDGLMFRQFDSIEKFLAFLDSGLIEPGIIYAHNGGRFDFFFLLEAFEGRTMIIGSRIVRAFKPIGDGKRRFDKGECFEFRDSFAIMPFPLAQYRKDKIDIQLLHKKVRHLHMEEITKYLEGDCVYLWELCMGFQREFGDYKTIASAAFAQLSTFHKYETLPLKQDEQIRSKYYFGGRVQCFEKGIINKPVEIYDVNSMYPFVMDSYFHPVTWFTLEDTRIHGWNPDGTFNDEKLKTFFLTVEGENFGAFAQRQKNGGVEFTAPVGVFHTTIHEYLVAIELGLFKPHRIVTTLNYNDYSRFHLFVDHFYRAREKTKLDFKNHSKDCAGCAMQPPEMCAMGSDIHAHNLYYKYILNSAYGKFGLNPENYFNWRITKTEDIPAGEDWQLDSLTMGKYYVWKQPNQLRWNVKNIGTAASITGAARSVLLRAIANSGSVLYCDTDSIICQGFAGGTVDDKQLGAWKLEGAGVSCAIAGKKLYAVFNSEDACIKHANKGVNITPDEIRAAANGENIFWVNDAPTFKRDGSATFLSRTVRMT